MDRDLPGSSPSILGQYIARLWGKSRWSSQLRCSTSILMSEVALLGSVFESGDDVQDLRSILMVLVILSILPVA